MPRYAERSKGFRARERDPTIDIVRGGLREVVGKLERALEARGRGVVFFDRKLRKIDRVDRVAWEHSGRGDNGVRVDAYCIREDPRDGWIEELVIAKVDLRAIDAGLARAMHELAFSGLRHKRPPFCLSTRRGARPSTSTDDAQRVIGSRELESTWLARTPHDGEEFSPAGSPPLERP